MNPPVLNSARVTLRTWRDEDLKPFARMNSDPVVMKFMPALLSEDESNAVAEHIRSNLARRGWGLWAAELREKGEFIGFIGLSVPTFEAHFTPCVEVGWRLAKEYWGCGLATEGARLALEFGFAKLTLEEIVSFTAAANLASIRVMEKIRMNRSPADDFRHPKLPAQHSLSQHVLYRLSRREYYALDRR